MPIPREFVVGFSDSDQWWETFISNIKSKVKIEQPLSEFAWVAVISQSFRIDKELSADIFNRLIDDEFLLFSGRNDNQNLYVNPIASIS